MTAPRAPIVHLHLDLTNHCNFRCEFCFHFGDLTARRGFMDTALAHRLIDEAADKGLATAVSSAVFGEALLHPDFFQIAAHAVKRGLAFTLNTKGGLLDAATAQRICETGIDKVIISLNTPDEASHKVNHGPSGMTYAALVDRIREMIRWKLRLRSSVHLYIYLMNTHFARPRGLAFLEDHNAAARGVAAWHQTCTELAAEEGVPPPPPLAALAGRDLVRRKWPIDRGIELLPGVELVLKEAHLWANRIVDPTLEPVPTTRGFCSLPWEMLTVHWDGACSLCCLDYNRDVIVGNVSDSTLEAVFSGERIRKVREGFLAGRVLEPLCQKCLGGLRDRRTGAVVKRAPTSRLGHAVAGVRKYGVLESLRYGIARLRGA